MPTYDFIVIGSGIAGLSYTVKVAQHFAERHIPIKIALITKTVAEETNTKYAQGGIAAVWDNDDSFEKHIEDTMVAGDFISDPAVVEMVVREAPERLKELIAYGTDFDRKSDGSFDLVKEGGHSDKRILHYKDSTGNEIERALLAKVKSFESVDFFTHYFAVDLITQHHLGEKVTKDTPGKQCYGVYVLNKKTKRVETFLGRQHSSPPAESVKFINRRRTQPLLPGMELRWHTVPKVLCKEWSLFNFTLRPYIIRVKSLLS
jgi:L-aspartate oxidase